ncbi:MAG TPA: membrane protein insertion efficiency factor YidD, partial [Sutterella sp.]|nr:membrane protein insertion efficiency factor YidD [Sutterella sp.]
MMAKVFIAFVRLYQLTFSGWVGWQCRYIPTCSNYAIEAFERFGALKGLW